MNIFELAKQSGMVYREFEDEFANGNTDGVDLKTLQAFANLVEAQEREACAALCFSIWNKWLDTPEEDRYKVLYDAEDCAAAIRARGNT